MRQPIIPIPRVAESWIAGLIAAGILEVTDHGLTCKENIPTTDRKSE